MPLHQAIILAIVQGLTEFLPISSSAHLALAPWLFGWKDQGLAFDIALHFGTLAAVLIYFFRDWLQVIAQGFGISYSPDPELRLNRPMLWLLAMASLPIGVFGFLFEDYAETTLRSPIVIGVMLIVVGLLMVYADRVSRRDRGIGTITIADAMVIGLAQAVAIIPGTSRSGITITAGLFRNIDRHAAARFSFLLSTPAIAAASLKAFYDLWKAGGVAPSDRTFFFTAIGVSAVTGCLVIAFLLRFLRHNSLTFFVYYRVILGIVILALALFTRTG
jgi:undecaprenyl-diphosphatase